MSQASRSKIRARVRESESVARFIADTCVESDIFCGMCHAAGEVDGEPCDACGGSGDGRDAKMRALLEGGEPFDVAMVREAAEALVALEGQQDVFEDWCRERGQGPETMPSWPGNLARVYAYKTVECEACLGSGEVGPHTPAGPWPMAVAALPGMIVIGDDGQPREAEVGEIIRAPCPVCRGRGSVTVRNGARDPRAPMGRALARLGRRVLRALEGQPSIRGRLHPAEWSAQMRRKGREACQNVPADELMVTLYEAGREAGWAYRRPSGEMTTATRECRRMEHRDIPGYMVSQGWSTSIWPHGRAVAKRSGAKVVSLDAAITARGLLSSYCHQPRWLIGENENDPRYRWFARSEAYRRTQLARESMARQIGDALAPAFSDMITEVSQLAREQEQGDASR